MGTVDGHFILTGGAQDLHLKLLATDEGKSGLSLLLVPSSPPEAVHDDHLLAILIESRVEVKGNVAATTQIHSELFGIGLDSSSNGYEQFVINSIE